MRDFFALFMNMRNRHYLVLDVVAMLSIPLIATILRLDTAFSWEMYRDSLMLYTAVSILVKLPVYFRFGMYRHLWKYASIEEVSVILLGVVTAAFIFNLLYLVVLRNIDGLPVDLPRSILPIDLLMSLSFHGGIRLLSRLFSTELRKRSENGEKKTNVLIVGAGSSGTMIAKEMLRNPFDGLNPVGFIDDDPRKVGGVVNGIPVLGGKDMIPEFVKELKVAQVLIAMPSAPGKAIRSIIKIAEPLKVKVKTLPGVGELLNDVVDMRQFREVRIEDLLRRSPVKTDMTPVRKSLSMQRVLVTGAGGSIGSEICRLVAQSGPAELILLGHGENSIHSINRELIEKHPQLPIRAVIADIRDPERMQQVIGETRPAFIYHAAAHKHVPLMEDNLSDAISNNVLGTITLLKCALEAGVENVTMISTDKAVRPRSIMGVTKRLAEIALQLAAREGQMNYVVVRFGNVLGSRGSVIPIFQDQIAKGGPITITHPEMRRYFMTIPEAVQLVLQASILKANGEINVLDMGEPERILDLALDLIQLSGLVPYKDISIVYTGLRPGEKLTEELFRDGEVFSKSRHEKIFSVVDPVANHNSGAGASRPPSRVAKAKIEFPSLAEMEYHIRRTLLVYDHHSNNEIARKISDIVPEFLYQVFEEAQKPGASVPLDRNDYA